MKVPVVPSPVKKGRASRVLWKTKTPERGRGITSFSQRKGTTGEKSNREEKFLGRARWV